MSVEVKFLPLTLEELPHCATSHKDEGYRFVQMLCVKTDNGTDMQYSFMKGNVLENYTIKDVQKTDKIPSITEKYLNAFVFENEAHDLFGMNIEGNLLDFGGKFYAVSVKEPMTIISPAQKEAREKAAKIAAAKAAKEAGTEAAPKASPDKGAVTASSGLDAKLAGMDPEKAAKVKAAMESKAAREATQAAAVSADVPSEGDQPDQTPVDEKDGE